jgi:maltooligosyltrehalose trehalohydrolase
MTARFGAIPAAHGFLFRVWAPEATRVTLHLSSARHGGRISIFDLPPAKIENRDPTPVSARRQVREICVPDAEPGDRYAYSLADRDPLPDPASRFQPDGVHGWSEIVDPRHFRWTDGDWRGLDARRAVIYELHVGTFTSEGTFRGAMTRLPCLRDLGVTAIELMPVGDFAGARNWGYDGVALFAPSRAYGRPDELRAFVDAAHRHGLAVIFDVVYNHLGPEGAYLPAFSPPFQTTSRETPWGAAVNLDGPGSDVVRQLLIDNALHWVHEYHADGLRLDATHSLFDSGTPHFVAELAAAVHRAPERRTLVYAEDHRNLATLIEDRSHGGWGLDGVWADDFHHVVRRMVAGDAHGYYQDFRGTAGELATIFRHGWLFTGQTSRHMGEPRGTQAAHVPLRKSVICIQNHDQIGNRALGDRLNHAVDEASWRAATTLLLTAPMTPLLFMGQEWAASSPFAFFTDFEPRLGEDVVAGRRREFAAFPEFAGAAAQRIPSPQAESTFESSKLRWDERASGQHARSLALHRRLLDMRAAHASLSGSEGATCEAEAIGDDALAFVRSAPGDDSYLVVVRLRGEGAVAPSALRARPWTPMLHTEEPEFAGEPRPPIVDAAAGRLEFQRPGAMVFRT